MRIIRCPQCDEPQPNYANFCAACGENFISSPTSVTARLSRPRSLRVPRFFTLSAEAEDDADVPGRAWSTLDTLAPARGWPRSSPAAVSPAGRNANWHKIVNEQERPPRTPSQPRIPATAVYSALLPSEQAYDTLMAARRRSSLFLWVSALLTVAVVGGGLLGVIITLGHSTGALGSLRSKSLALQVTPSAMALGALITVRGTNFSPGGRIGLTRDTAIPVVDTGDTSLIRADSRGNFTDTLLAAPGWRSGPHVIRAEDAHLHRSAAFAIFVTGHSAPLRPAHLLLSSSIVNLGSEDQAGNSLKMLTLTDAGGGEITWRATTTRSWLMLSPTGGTFASGQAIHVMLAATRANLRSGSYSGQVIFTSNAGQATLPVNMQTRQLLAGKQAVLQLTPPLLSFSAADNGVSPAGQVIRVSNPGKQPLQWSASLSAGSDWLSAQSLSGEVAPGGSQAVAIDVNSTNQLPGISGAFVTFTSQAHDSPQSVYISLTIAAQCALQVSPGSLTFAGLSLQQGTSSRGLDVAETLTCTQPLKWSAVTSAGSWLHISATQGITFARPVVSIDAAGLQPGQYYASITFMTAATTQTLPVTLIITGTQTATPLLQACTIAATPGALTFAGVTGRPATAVRPVTITASSGCQHTQNWAIAIAGSPWITATQTTGSLNPGSAARTSIGVTLAGLGAGTYTARLSISAVDSATHVHTVALHPIEVTLTVQRPCTLQAPAGSGETFNSERGANPVPASQSFTLGISGACANAITIIPRAANSWLAITPTRATTSGGRATFTVRVTSSALTAGDYNGAISLAALSADGGAIPGSPRTLAVTLHVRVPATLALSTPALTFNVAGGTTSQPIVISNTGGGALNWTATLGGDAPTFVSLSAGAGANLAGGASTSVGVIVDAASIAGGSNFTTSVTFNATAVLTGGATAGSPSSVVITINITPPAMQLNTNTLVYTTGAGVNPSSQSISLSNAGGDGLTWKASAPSQEWLSLGLTGGSVQASTTSSIPFNIDVAGSGLSSGTYTATVVITPSVGQAQTVSVTLTVTS
jgi:Viral BACON domain